jgi:hypothetical protein
MPRIRTCLTLIASLTLIVACGSESSSDGTTVETTSVPSAKPVSQMSAMRPSMMTEVSRIL